MILAGRGWVEQKFLVFFFDGWGTHSSRVRIPYGRHISLVSGVLSFMVLYFFAVSVVIFVPGGTGFPKAMARKATFCFLPGSTVTVYKDLVGDFQ